MMKTEYEIGDKAWIYIDGHKGKLTEGRVVHKFHLDGWAVPFHYIVEIPTHIDSLIEVREPMSMSDAPDKQIGMWQLIRSWRR